MRDTIKSNVIGHFIAWFTGLSAYLIIFRPNEVIDVKQLVQGLMHPLLWWSPIAIIGVAAALCAVIGLAVILPAGITSVIEDKFANGTKKEKIGMAIVAFFAFTVFICIRLGGE